MAINTSIRAGLHRVHAQVASLRERFMSLWLSPPQHIVSIALQAERAMLVELTPVGTRYMATSREVQLRSTEPRDIAEEIALVIARENWEKAARVLVVPEKYAHSYIVRLPEMEPTEAHTAAYWELVPLLVADGLVADDEEITERYTYVGMPLSTADYYVSAVDSSCADEYMDAFSAAECPLTSIVIGAPNAAALTRLAGDMLAEWQVETSTDTDSVDSALYSEALYGGLSYLAPPVPPASCVVAGRSVESSERYCYPRIGGAIIAATFIILLVATGIELYTIHGLNAASEQVRSDLALKSTELKRMQILENVARETAAKEQQLTKLTEGNISWYGVLVHLGTLTVDGVRIEKMWMQGTDTLRIDGYAVTYEALAEFLTKFEQDSDFFSHGPLLQSTTTEASGLTFTISLGL